MDTLYVEIYNVSSFEAIGFEARQAMHPRSNDKRDRAIGDASAGGRSRWARRFKEAQLATHQEPPGRNRPFVLQVIGDITPSGEAIGLRIECSKQGPVELCIRTEDVKYLVSLLLSLGCEAKGRQSSPPPDVPPTEAIPLPLDAINVGRSDDNQPFLLLEVGIASLMFMVSPTCLDQLGQTMLMLSTKSSSAPS